MLDRGALKNKFENYGSEPSEGLWNSISSKIDQHKRKRKGIIWFTFGTGIAASLIILFKLVLTNTIMLDHVAVNKPEIIELEASTTIIKEQIIPIETIKNQTKNLIEEKEEQPNKLQGIENIKSKIIKTITPVHNTILSKIIIDTSLLTPITKEIFKQKNEQIKQIKRPLIAFNQNVINPIKIDVIKNKSNAKRWSYEVNLQHAVNNNSTLSPNWVSQSSFESLTGLDAQRGPDLPINPEEKYKLKFPLQIQFYSTYSINRFLFVKTGLEHSTFHTKYWLLNGSESHYKRKSIGIPFKLGFQLLKRKRIRLKTEIGQITQFDYKRKNYTKEKAFIRQNQSSEFAISKLSFLYEINYSIGYAINEYLILQLNPGFRFGQKLKYFNINYGLKFEF